MHALQIAVVYAEHDTPEFRVQSLEFTAALHHHHHHPHTTSHDIAAADHFDVIERLSESSFAVSVLVREMLAM